MRRPVQPAARAERSKSAAARLAAMLAVSLALAGAESRTAVAIDAPAAGHGAVVKGSVTVLDGNGRPKASNAGVVVFLDEMAAPVPAALAPQPAALRQRDKSFVPEVLPIVVGSTVEFPNEDTVHHNVFSLSRAKSFDLGIYPQGASRSVEFDETGLVKVYCNIHPQMVASIVVLANPWFTVTEPDGTFVIEGVPPGAATVRTWYARAREHPEQRIQVARDGIYDVDLRVLEDLQLEVREEAFSVRHKNKWGQDYPTKY